MAKGKKIREKGKLRLSSCFKEIEDGREVAILIDKGVPFNFAKRLQGKCGVVVGSQGNFKIIKLMEGSKERNLVIHPVHLKKI